MRQIKLEDGLKYDGSQIQPLWAFQNSGIKGSSIVTWTGPMEIEPDQLIDYEDVGQEIKAQEMLHFIVEHFDVQPADLRLGYHRQRMLVIMVKDLLGDMGLEIRREGDDLYHEGGKLSVSIATCSNSSMKIHLGLNLKTDGTPDDVETAGLLDIINISSENISELVDKICRTYIAEISSIEGDIAKTRVF
jgi:hypothetical protein